jgi:hypothetical protein
VHVPARNHAGILSRRVVWGWANAYNEDLPYSAVSSVNALREQFLHTVIDEFGIAAANEMTRQRAGDARTRIDLPEQERATIASELTPGKSATPLHSPRS